MSEPSVTLGKAIPDGQPAHRDAVHVAVLPVVADQDLSAGDRVGVRDGRASRRFQPHIGVVDPFLAGAVLIDQRCYVCLFPGTVTGMRHHWTHPGVSEYDAVTLVPAEDPLPGRVPPTGPVTVEVTEADFAPRRPGPAWRTDTVVKLCQQMRQDDDYTALPALADALDEAEYSDITETRFATSDLRKPVSKHQARRIVALLFSPETALAVRAMEALVDRMNDATYTPEQNAIVFDFMLEAGDKWRLKGEYTVEEGNITWSQALWGMGEEYWAAYEAITGQAVEGHHDAPFTCHC